MYFFFQKVFLVHPVFNGKRVIFISVKTYKSFLLGEVELNPDRDIWVAPPGRKEVKEVWIDRVYLTRARP